MKMNMDLKTFERFAIAAYDAGMPRDQLERFYSYQYIPLNWQLKFHAAARQCDHKNTAVDIGVGGARGPGKSHGVFAQVALDDCQRFAGLKFLFLRQTGKAASESFEDLIYKVLTGKIKYNYRKGNLLEFPNSSRIILGGFETENDIDKYVGIEYDGMAVEELNQLTQDKIDKLKGSLRTSREDWRPRMYSSFNPGGIGHVFVKETYVVPYREKRETKTRFIPSTYKDNPYLNPEYRDYLESLGGSLGKAWREGDFDIFEGQFFMEWNREYHVVEPFKISATWQKFRSIDPSGRVGITSCHWYALDWDGNVYVCREYYQSGKDSDEHADKIAELSSNEDYRYSIIDAAAFSKLGLPETQVEIYERHGVNGLMASSKNRIMGWDIVHQYLRWDKIKELTKEREEKEIVIKPKLRIFSTCYNMIRTIPTLIHDEKNPEDVNTQGEDHAADDLRYFLQTLRETKTPKPLSTIERRLKAIQDPEEFSFKYRK